MASVVILGQRLLRLVVTVAGPAEPVSGGCMRVVPQELTAQQQAEKQRKIDYLEVNTAHFTGYESVTDLLTMTTGFIFTLFNPIAAIVLTKERDNYQVGAIQGLMQDPGRLKLGQTGSIVRVACESSSDRQGIIYFPNVAKDQLFLGREFDQASGATFTEGVQAVYTGRVADFGVLIDLGALRSNGTVRSVVCLPLFDIDGRTPLGALVLLNDRVDFLDPLVDFGPLHLLAKTVAKNLRLLA